MGDNNLPRENDREWAAPWTLQRKIRKNIQLLEEMSEIIRRNTANARLHTALTKVEKIETDLRNEINQLKAVNERDGGIQNQVLDKGVFMY